MTNKYFILHEDVDVFTSHGVLRINTLHDAFKAGQLDNSFKVAIIPYTYEHTNFHQIKVGSVVNLEFDIIGKYISRLLNLNIE